MWSLMSRKKAEMPSAEEALPGRQQVMPVALTMSAVSPGVRLKLVSASRMYGAGES